MSTKAEKVRVGLFTAVAAALVTIILVTFAGLRFWEGRDRYRIVFDGSVMGLEKGARVFMNGMRVGSVDDIAVSADDIRKVEVTIAIREGTPVRADTRAMLQHAGITGLKVIDLRGATNASPRLPPGSTIAQGETLLDRLQGHAETLAQQSAELMTRANRIVGQLEGVDEVVANLADASRSLKDMIPAVEQTTRSAKKLVDDQLAKLLASADTLVNDVKGVVHRNDTALRTAMFDLKQASRTFKDLAREVRQRPSRLLFSQPASERKLP
jgi:phospholipid/cholesterol/gamma-HCH transport system substrate-binding protein